MLWLLTYCCRQRCHNFRSQAFLTNGKTAFASNCVMISSPDFIFISSLFEVYLHLVNFCHSCEACGHNHYVFCHIGGVKLNDKRFLTPPVATTKRKLYVSRYLPSLLFNCTVFTIVTLGPMCLMCDEPSLIFRNLFIYWICRSHFGECS